MGDFNQMLTKDEEDFQFLLQVVSEYRKKYSHYAKASLITEQLNEILE